MKKTDNNSLLEKQVSERINDDLDGVKEADVIVTNSDQTIVVGFKKLPPKYNAPFLITKGAGCLAGMMMETALNNGIYICENSALARMVYYCVDICELIPLELLMLVEEVYAQFYSDTKKTR
jgi:flagellar biosynthesis protein FlhB